MVIGTKKLVVSMKMTDIQENVSLSMYLYRYLKNKALVIMSDILPQCLWGSDLHYEPDFMWTMSSVLLVFELDCQRKFRVRTEYSSECVENAGYCEVTNTTWAGKKFASAQKANEVLQLYSYTTVNYLASDVGLSNIDEISWSQWFLHLVIS